LKSVDALSQLEFIDAGSWILNNKNGDLSPVWEESFNKGILDNPNVLYAFVVDDSVKYIGKTSKSIKKRFVGYCKPGNSQQTNFRCNQRIKEHLAKDKKIRIHIFSPVSLLQYGTYSINLAAGLEDALIKDLEPEWNGGKFGKKQTESAELEKEALDIPKPTTKDYKTPVNTSEFKFDFTLQKTYFDKGFINVGVKGSEHLGQHGDLVTLFLGNEHFVVTSKINRTANLNHSVRVIGNNAIIANWFQKNFKEGQKVSGMIKSNNIIFLNNPDNVA